MAQGRSTEIISMAEWIRTSRLSIKKSLSAGAVRGDGHKAVGVCVKRCVSTRRVREAMHVQVRYVVTGNDRLLVGGVLASAQSTLLGPVPLGPLRHQTSLQVDCTRGVPVQIYNCLVQIYNALVQNDRLRVGGVLASPQSTLLGPAPLYTLTPHPIP